MKLKALLATFSCIFLFSQSVFAVESEEAKIAQNLLKLKALNSCLECNLSGADLTNADLAKADLSGADLKYVKFSNILVYSKGGRTGEFHSLRDGSYPADLKGANLKGANLKNAKLALVNLTDADLSGANLTDAYLWEAHLKNANLTGAILKDTKVEGAIFCNTKTPWGLDNSGCKKE